MSTTPTAIGRYQIVRVLGTGGMGAVYLARDPELDRPVAIKLVKDALIDDPELRERFSREARSAARLHHPNIITIFDLGEYEGRPYIAMEYVAGESLSDVLRRQSAVELTRVMAWMESLCRGLAHAHQAGVVHRDIKPANMMVDADGALKIVDFGIARMGDSHLTQAGMLVGTANYMAPEQLLGTPTDHRADIFAVGAVFYELLTGRKAFGGTISDGLFNRICHEPPESLSKLCPTVDPEIITIVDRVLEKDPQRRYQDLTSLANDIAGVRARLFGEAPFAATKAPDSDLTYAEVDPTPRPSTSPGSGSKPRTSPSLSGGTPKPSRSYDLRIDDSPSQRSRQADIFVDAAEAALRSGNLAKARDLATKAAHFDPEAPAVLAIRTQIDQAEQEAADEEKRRAETESALSAASECISRGEFSAARDHLNRAAAAGCDELRVQSLWSNLQRAESALRERQRLDAGRQRLAAAAEARRRKRLPWIPILLVVAVIAMAAIYLLYS